MWGGASIVAEAVGLILGSTTSLDLQLGLVYSCRTTVGALAVALVEMLLPILAPPRNPASSLVQEFRRRLQQKKQVEDPF